MDSYGGDGGRDEIRDTYVVLLLRNLRTLVRVVSERIAELDRRRLRSELLEELVVDPRLNEDSRAGTACLTVIPATLCTHQHTEIKQRSISEEGDERNGDPQDSVRAPVDREVQIRVVEDDIRALSPKFERNILQVRLRRPLHDLPPNQSRTSEGQLLDIHMRRHSVADGRTVADENVDYTRREASFVDERGHTEGSERSEFGRLEDDGVSARKSRADLPAHQHDCERIHSRQYLPLKPIIPKKDIRGKFHAQIWPTTPMGS